MKSLRRFGHDGRFAGAAEAVFSVGGDLHNQRLLQSRVRCALSRIGREALRLPPIKFGFSDRPDRGNSRTASPRSRSWVADGKETLPEMMP
jgi:hypothetical protein